MRYSVRRPRHPSRSGRFAGRTALWRPRFRRSRRPGFVRLREYQAGAPVTRKAAPVALREEAAAPPAGARVARLGDSCREECLWHFLPGRSAARGPERWHLRNRELAALVKRRALSLLRAGREGC